MSLDRVADIAFDGEERDWLTVIVVQVWRWRTKKKSART